MTKVKTIASVDVEKISSLKELAAAVATPNRCSQALEALYKLDPALATYGKEPSLKEMGLIVKWVRDDILKEEADLLAASGVGADGKELWPHVSPLVSAWFKAYMVGGSATQSVAQCVV